MPMDNKSKRELFIMKKATENPKKIMDFIKFLLNKYNINDWTIKNYYRKLEYFFNEKIAYKDDLHLYSFRKKLLNRWANVYEYIEFVGVAAFVINVDSYDSEKYDFKDEQVRLENLFALTLYHFVPEVLGRLLFELACLYKNTKYENLSISHAFEAINFYNIVKYFIRYDTTQCNENIALIYKVIFNNNQNYKKYLGYAYGDGEYKEPVLKPRLQKLLTINISAEK